MKIKRTTKALVLFTSLILIGCATGTKLKDYQPNSLEEKEVRDFMVECFEAHKVGNSAKFIACFNDNAEILFDPPGLGDRIISKQEAEIEYSNIIYKNLASNLFSPKISIMKSGVTFTCTTLRIGRSYPARITVEHRFDLVKENEKWGIIKWDWKQYY